MRLKSIVTALTAMLFMVPLAAKSPVVPAVPADPAPTPENTWLLDLSTGGQVAIQLRPDMAPAHVERIKTLTRQGFYNGLVFHRVIDGFMAQTGDPTATGQGGSPLADLKAEFNALPHLRGTVSMARATEPDSANSQFFIMFGPRMSLDRKYSAFGRVISGMAHIDAIERGEPPANPSRIIRATLAADSGAPSGATNVPPPASTPPDNVSSAETGASAAEAPAPSASAPEPPPFSAAVERAPSTTAPEPPPFSAAVERVKDAPQR